MRRLITSVIAGALLGAGALVPAAALAAPASVDHATYIWDIGVGPATGPDVSMAPNGSTISMSGSGKFNAGPSKSVTGGGSYRINDASGRMIASGSWTATKMLGFVNYGSGAAQGLPQFVYGGQATMMVTLSGVGSGVLDINCTLGSPPPGHGAMDEEGIDLSLGNGLTFNREVSGETVFINPAQIP